MKCIVCGSEEGFTKLSPTLCKANNWLCSGCGLIFIPRDSEEKHDYYKEGGYYTSSPNLAARQFLTSKYLLLQLAKERVNRIENLWPIDLVNKKVLDVGCGYGELLGYLKLHRQCDVVGIEPSLETATMGERLFSIKIIPALLEDHDFGGEMFDFLICNHAFEHVSEPRRFLDLLRSRLKPAGLLYLEVPNVMWPSGGFTLDNFLYDEHLQTFSSWNLSLLLNQCGFKVYAFSDRDFLRFFCGIGDSQKPVKIQPLGVDEIYGFLRQYKKNYSIEKRAHVYLGKLIYLGRLIYSKIIDVFSK